MKGPDMIDDLDQRLRDELRGVARTAEPSPRLDMLIRQLLNAPPARPRTPLLSAAAALVLVLAGMAVVVTNLGSDTTVDVGGEGGQSATPVESTMSGSTGARLVVMRESGPVLVDVDGQSSAPLTVPGLPADAVLLERVLFVGGRVVATLGPPGATPRGDDMGTVSAFDPGTGARTVLGPAVGAVASVKPDRVWLRSAVAGREVVRETTVLGVVTGTPVELADDSKLVGAAGEVLVVAGRVPFRNGLAERIALVDTATGAVRPLGERSRFVAAVGNQVAWVDSADGTLHLRDVVSGADRRLTAPPGRTAFAAGGAFSPDGTRLAAFAMMPRDAEPEAELVLIDVARATASLVPRTTFSVGEAVGHATWTPSGQWVFFGQMGSRIVAAANGGASVGELRLPGKCFCWEAYVAVS